jgi:hypothetical protein
MHTTQLHLHEGLFLNSRKNFAATNCSWTADMMSCSLSILRYVLCSRATVSFLRRFAGDSFPLSDHVPFSNEHVSRHDTVRSSNEMQSCCVAGSIVPQHGFQSFDMSAGPLIICSNLAELQHHLETCAIRLGLKCRGACLYIPLATLT